MRRFVHRQKTTSLIIVTLALVAAGCGPSDAVVWINSDGGGLPDAGHAEPRVDGGDDIKQILAITPSMADFGLIALGDASEPITFVVKNIGDGATGPLGIVVGGADMPHFAFGPAGTCVPGTTVLQGDESCTVSVVFSPSTGGAKAVLLTVSAAPGGITTSTLTGNGDGQVDLELTPSEQDFSTVALGTKSDPVSFTVTNPGATPAGVLDLAFVGADAAEFAFAPGGTCIAGTTLLAADGSCTILVEFAPTTLGAKLALLSVSASPGGIAAATLTGTGTGSGSGTANLAIAPSEENFGAIATGETSAPTAFTVTNTGDAATGVLDLELVGADAAEFAFAPGGTCVAGTTLLAADGSCTIQVEFAPTTLGAKLALLSVSASPGGIAAATLTGTGTDGVTGPVKLTVTPDVKNFGTIAVGGTSASVSFTVANADTGASGPIHIALDGADATQFAFVAGGTCFSGSTVLAGGASCKVSVRFAPTAEGAKSASLAVTATPGGSAAAALTGTGSIMTSTLVIAPTSMDFGVLPVGSLSATRSFLVANSGSAATGKLQLAFGGADAADFLSTSGGTCVFDSIGLLPGAACTVYVRFRPATEGAKTATLTVSATPGGVATATLTGTAVPPITHIATGGMHTCATNGTLDRPGLAWCWGDNRYGQLGDGTLSAHPAPTPVQGLASVVELTAGSAHSCAREADGSVLCWGYNAYGQLGDGSTANRSTPTLLPGLADVEQLVVGDYHSCARRGDGSVLCWGSNNYGQLGDGGTNRSTPTFIPGLSDVVEIAAGGTSSYGDVGGHTCARGNDGTVRCWGRNDRGQVGDGTTSTSRPGPTVVAGLTGVAWIAAGGSHNCAMTSDGTLFCWGSNTYGELGLGDGMGRSTPALVPLFGVSQVALGSLSTCARGTDGTVRCWGNGGYGNLSASPTTIPDLAGVSEIALGVDGSHGCALSPDMRVVCWGSNRYGQVGDGSYADRMPPVDVLWP